MNKKLPLYLLQVAMLSSWLATLFVHAQNSNETANRRDKATVELLKRTTQELLDAIAPGDAAVWQKYLVEGCLYTDEEGNVKTKDDLIKEIKPLPQGYIGTIKMGEPKVVRQDNLIVLVHRDREELTLFG